MTATTRAFVIAAFFATLPVTETSAAMPDALGQMFLPTAAQESQAQIVLGQSAIQKWESLAVKRSGSLVSAVSR